MTITLRPLLRHSAIEYQIHSVQRVCAGFKKNSDISLVRMTLPMVSEEQDVMKNILTAMSAPTGTVPIIYLVGHNHIAAGGPVGHRRRRTDGSYREGVRRCSVI